MNAQTPPPPPDSDQLDEWKVRATDVPPIAPEGFVNPLGGEAPLCPNRADISAHLYALFPHEFVQAYHDLEPWIEIAYGNPAVDEGQANAAKNFSPFKLEEAVAFAETKNKAGFNVYVGAALRHGERPSSGRASGYHILAASHSWTEYDNAGDDERIGTILTTKSLIPAFVVTTGTVPHPRRQLCLLLDSAAKPDDVRAANAALKELLGADKVANPDRLLRLAGTVSRPPQHKKDRGYVAELVTLHHPRNSRAYSLSELVGAAPGGGGGRSRAGYNESEEKPAPTRESFFKDVNALALARPSHWVKPLFGNLVRFYPGPGCWRTTTEANKTLPGRSHLQESVSISQRGVWDYGFEKPSDPISLVMDYGPRKAIVQLSAKDAAFWLCERMDIAPEALGWGTKESRSADDARYAGGYDFGGQGGQSSAGEGEGARETPRPITATPYAWKRPEDIARREWLYGDLLIRKFVAATVSPGGVGKSSLTVVEALAMVSGKNLLGVDPPRQLRVWLWNLEDPQEETERKIQAAALHYGLSPDDIGGRLFADSGRDQRLVIATTERSGVVIVRPVVDAIVSEIINRQIDVIIIDPFVSCHEVPENDNTAQDMVVKEWGRVADRGNCAVHLVDHTRKMGGTESEVTTESARGAKSKTDACRIVRAVNRMSKDEGGKAGVENHRLYFRTYNDKANLAPPADKSDWFKLQNVDLPNGHLGGPGDGVGVVTTWEWPDHLAGVTGADFDKVAAAVRAGKWRADIQCKKEPWVGVAVAKALGLDLSKNADKAKVKGLLKVWLMSGALVEVTRKDADYKDKQYIEVREDD